MNPRQQHLQQQPYIQQQQYMQQQQSMIPDPFQDDFSGQLRQDTQSGPFGPPPQHSSTTTADSAHRMATTSTLATSDDGAKQRRQKTSSMTVTQTATQTIPTKSNPYPLGAKMLAEMNFQIDLTDKKNLFIPQRLEAYLKAVPDCEKGLHRFKLEDIGNATNFFAVINSPKISGVTDNTREQFLFRRELFAVQSEVTIAQNLSAFGWATSYVKSLPQSEQHIATELATLMRIPILVADGHTKMPFVLSVCAPGSVSEIGTNAGKVSPTHTYLNIKAYKAAMKHLHKHVLQCIETQPCDRVILSDVGMNDFLDSLQDNGGKDCLAAREIRAKAFAKLAYELIKRKHCEVLFTHSDADGDPTFWRLVSKELVKLKTTQQINFVGTFPGTWVRDKDLIVNGCVPGVLVGDPTSSGLNKAIGNHSPAHLVHALRSIIFSVQGQ